MIKGNCAQSVVPRRGEKFNLLGCYGAHTDQLQEPVNREDVVTFVLENLSPIF